MEYRGRFSNAAVTIASMSAQCSCIEFVLLQIQDAFIHKPEGAFRLRSDTAFVKHFMSVFGACQLLFSIINQRFGELMDGSVNSHGEMTKTARVKNVWNDSEMKDLLRNLESQACAINLLLSALQMLVLQFPNLVEANHIHHHRRSNAEIHTLLNKRQSIYILDKAADQANSLATAEGARNIVDHIESRQATVKVGDVTSNQPESKAIITTSLSST